MNVTAQAQSPAFCLHNERLIPALQHMTDALMAPIEPNGVTHIEPLHRPREIALHRLEQQMIMVGHQNIGVQPESKTLLPMRQQLNEMRVIPFIAVNRFSLIAARTDVIPSSRAINSQQSGHGPNGRRSPINVKQCLMDRSDPNDFLFPTGEAPGSEAAAA